MNAILSAIDAARRALPVVITILGVVSDVLGEILPTREPKKLPASKSKRRKKAR